jgi:hypothetical protein
MNCYAGTSEQNGHMKETPKAAAYSYSQWKISRVSFLSLPWNDLQMFRCVMLQINIRIERSSAGGLTRKGKCSKQKLKSSQFHTALLVTHNRYSW